MPLDVKSRCCCCNKPAERRIEWCAAKGMKPPPELPYPILVCRQHCEEVRRALDNHMGAVTSYFLEEGELN